MKQIYKDLSNVNTPNKKEESERVKKRRKKHVEMQ